jgi:hypothetical protein
MDKFCVVVQGPSNHVDRIKLSFSGVPIIFSTWVGSEGHYKSDDIVVYNEHPSESGVGNTNYQKVTTLNGLRKAKELGYTRALKIRSDMIPTNLTEFINLLDTERLTLFSWHFVPGTNVKAYVVDYLMAGCIDDLIKMWSFDLKYTNIPETMLTSSIIKNFENREINYLVNRLTDENSIYWIKYNTYLSDYKNIRTSSWFAELDMITNKDIVNVYKGLNL